jgi:predicted N-acetyltransferase YhbS
MPQSRVEVRPIEADDADAAAGLCTQLGYPSDAAAVLSRMRQIAGDRNRAVLVACVDGEVVGWIDLSVEYHLQSEPAALIGGLVVSDGVRNRGIGRQLCEAAEEWARGAGSAGCGSGRMRSGSGRMAFICVMGMHV